jgi:hypothetical protein
VAVSVTRKRKVIAVIAVALSGALIGYCWVEFCGGPVLAWKVVSVRQMDGYYVRDRWERNCWRVDIEVSNMTSQEVMVDWKRDKSAFEIAGRWEDLRDAGFMPYVGPTETRTFPVFVPQQSQACRLSMYYEHGPLWSFFRDHNIPILSNRLFPLVMNCDTRLPGHFKRLDIEVKLPPNTALEPTVTAVPDSTKP